MRVYPSLLVLVVVFTGEFGRGGKYISFSYCRDMEKIFDFGLGSVM